MKKSNNQLDPCHRNLIVINVYQSNVEKSYTTTTSQRNNMVLKEIGIFVIFTLTATSRLGFR
jgi:hypothetical protein